MTTLPQTPSSFGLTVGTAFIAFGTFALWRSSLATPYLLIIGITLATTGLLLPRLLKPVQIIWMSVAKIMGLIMTTILLSIVFYLLITPIGLLMRLTGKSSIKRTVNKKEASYWHDRSDETTTPNTLERQF